MDNRKFKLNKDSLEIVQLMQHMVFINVGVFSVMKDECFDDKHMQEEFIMRCNSYIRLHESLYTQNGWRCYYSDIQNPMINKYKISPNEDSKISYHLIIEINKPFNQCSRLCVQFIDKLSETVPINIFNIQFELGD